MFERGYDYANDADLVIRDDRKFSEFWNEISLEKQTLNIDFNLFTVVGSIRKVDSADYALEMTDASLVNNEIIIKTTFFEAGSNCSTSAYHTSVVQMFALEAVTLPGLKEGKLPVKFQIDRQRRDCVPK